MSVRILEGDCLAVMPSLPESSVDAIVCDPPYHLTTGKKGGSGTASLNPNSPAGRSRIGTGGFMGKIWDGGDVAFRPETWAAALRVAKPGAHLLAFGGTRTYHRLTCAIEDAGWDIRDCLSWLYGSGFPKSLDVSKAIDKNAGHWRGRANGVLSDNPALSGPNYGRTDKGDPIVSEAQNWAGWGTALKPAWEPIILARKPFRRTVAANVQEHGTGALNVDGCRIGCDERFIAPAGNTGESPASLAPVNVSGYAGRVVNGRWPANAMLDEEAAELLDVQSGTLHSGDAHVLRRGGTTGKGMGYGSSSAGNVLDATYGDSGGASRFFYTAKASRSERNAGLDGHPRKVTNTDTPPGTKGSESPRAGANRSGAVGNHHPTVKPLDLMQWLCRLVTPKGGLILDPFCGSGSTGRAAVAEGFSFIGIELDPEYAAIARARIADYAPLFGDVA